MAGFYLYLAVVISGASILALEILGTRLLGPTFGAGLYLWSALISVTLAALSVGYALGGRWADREPRLDRFSALFIGAGFWVVLIPWLRHPVLSSTEDLGLRAAVLIGGTVLFFPPLVLLGMVSPYAIRLKAANLLEVGRTAGNLYAVSTAASVLAAIATGFFLIPMMGVGHLTFMIGILLILTGALGMLVRRRARALPVALLVLAMGMAAADRAAPRDTPDPSRGLLAVTQSTYAEIRVVDHRDLRLMLIDGAPHSIVDMATLESDYAYVDVLGLPKEFFEEPGRMLLVGLGAGSLVKSYRSDGWQVDAVEIDSEVTRLAHEYFGLGPDEARIVHEDGRRFLVDHDDIYDLVIMDAFGSSAVPFHLVTVEAFSLIKSRLASEGMLAMNVEALGWDDILVRSLAVTLGRCFAHVKVLPVVEPPSALGNLILLASDRPLELLEELPTPADRWNADYNRVHAWDNGFEVAASRGRVLTDDHNPVAIWSNRVNLAAREHLHQFFGKVGPDR